MSQIVIGKAGNRNITLDLNILLRTRLLVQANSGGGKSWLLRRLAEQLFGKVQVIIIDPEGEFATLREKLDFILVGPGGETPADVRSAEMVARRLLELRISAICDLYEMKESERHTWLRLFLDALINAPKKLWHPMVLILDEASDFCPEGKAGGSEAAQAVMAFSRKGRKRGFCPIMATQSLATLDKKTSRHLHNRLIGPTFEDVDIERSIDLLSIAARDKKEFAHDIRTMEPGSFYAFGRAISKVRVLLEVGPVSTTHPDIGRSKIALKPPPPPSKIRALLPKLADLPKEAEQEAQTVAGFRKEIRSLKAQLRSQPAAPAKRVVERVVDQTATEKIVRRALQENNQHWQAQIAKLVRYVGQLRPILTSIAQQAAKAEALKNPVTEFAPPPKIQIPAGVTTRPTAPPPPRTNAKPARRPTEPVEFQGDPEELTPARKKILCALAEFEALGQSEVSRKWIAALAGVSHKSSAYTNNLGGLRSSGYIDYGSSSTLRFTEKGRTVTPPADPPASSQEMLERCFHILTPKQGDILKALHAIHPESLSRDELADAVGVSAKSSAYTNNLGAIRSAAMLDYRPNSSVRCEDWLFID